MDQGEESMQEILPGLYLGDCTAVMRLKSRFKDEAWHILSIGNFRKPSSDPTLVYMNIDLLDLPESNLIEHFDDTFAFIDQALENEGKVLVHCHAGVSRSATIVAAYLMRSTKLPLEDTLSKIRAQRSCIDPNPGFKRQLELYEELEYDVDPKHTQYRRFLVSVMAKKQQVASLPRSYSPKAPGKPEPSSQSPDPTFRNTKRPTKELRCKKCRHTLVDSEHIIEHKPGPGQIAFDYLKRDSELNISEVSTGSWTADKDKAASVNQPLNPLLASLAASHTKCASFFAEPIAWIPGKDDPTQLQGRIDCPKCMAKLGSYNWSGEQCSCGKWITPAFMLHRKQIDEVVRR